MNGHITISIDGIEIGDWGTEDAESVMDRFAAFVADRTGAYVELGGSRTVCDGANIKAVDVDGMLWEEFCSGHNDADFLAEYGPDAA